MTELDVLLSEVITIKLAICANVDLKDTSNWLMNIENDFSV